MKVSGSLAHRPGMPGRQDGNSGVAWRPGIDRGAGDRGGAREAGYIPESVRETVAVRGGEYDARRLRSQREVIRDVMLAAAECNTWLTLSELRALTRYGEASISAQLRHLRKVENGGYGIEKQRRDDGMLPSVGADGRGEFVWEYRMVNGG